ncbi:hypothetical protein C5167_032151 [Papaver somniferum]|uniref:Uncharacterized protein n=1 Tax=Papaver somniferum TaxID=3469 RepID=A0A4Y7KA08_PAPSO|nr:hypothetical protein C5167_032151 [Papaver somniferum]
MPPMAIKANNSITWKGVEAVAYADIVGEILILFAKSRVPNLIQGFLLHLTPPSQPLPVAVDDASLPSQPVTATSTPLSCDSFQMYCTTAIFNGYGRICSGIAGSGHIRFKSIRSEIDFKNITENNFAWFYTTAQEATDTSNGYADVESSDSFSLVLGLAKFDELPRIRCVEETTFRLNYLISGCRLRKQCYLINKKHDAEVRNKKVCKWPLSNLKYGLKMGKDRAARRHERWTCEKTEHEVPRVPEKGTMLVGVPSFVD